MTCEQMLVRLAILSLPVLRAMALSMMAKRR